MKMKGALTATVLLLLSTLGFIATAHAQGVFTGKEVPIAVGLGDQTDPSISGPIISFTDMSSGDADVYFYDERTKTTHFAATGPGDQEFSSVSGNLIAYTDYTGLAPAEVYTYDITTGITTNISNNPDSDQLNPAVSSQLVAWEDKQHVPQHIFVYILSSGKTQQISGGGPQAAPAASGGRVAYEDYSIGSQVKVWDFATGVTTTLAATVAGQPDLDGDNLAYVDMSGANWDVVVHNLTSGAETRLTLHGTGGGYPKISGEFVAFED
jgi:Tol biopolymer transport system component